MSFQSAFLTLIRETATMLPPDILVALIQARNREAQNSSSKLSLAVILKNLELATRQSTPLCQDTGFPSFFVRAPAKFWKQLRRDILATTKQATQLGYLRPNAVEILSNKNSGDNLGIDFPKIEFKDDAKISVELILKGGGSENVSDQISLPAELLDYGRAGRDLAGVKKAVLQIVRNAKGYGCAPGIIGVHIGGDRASGYAHAKRNLFFTLDAENPELSLKKLEAEILREANQLGIGPMGFGGRTTLLGCKISASHRLPASFFVTVAYNCWALRRAKIRLSATGKILRDGKINSQFLILNFQRISKAQFPNSKQIQNTKYEIPKFVKKLKLPLSEVDVRKLKVGDVVLLSGRIFTGRDRLHEYALTHQLKKDLRGSAIYHCGPVAIQDERKNWKMLAAGPTTSIREEPYEAEFIARTGVRAVIGKGGMGAKTATALKKFGAVYLHAIGGAAAFYADTIQKVVGVDYLEFGVPEALWEIEVEDFLAVVTMGARK